MHDPIVKPSMTEAFEPNLEKDLTLNVDPDSYCCWIETLLCAFTKCLIEIELPASTAVNVEHVCPSLTKDLTESVDPIFISFITESL
jgi:hypothetical protein